MKKLVLIVLLLIFLLNVNALEIEKKECNIDGSFLLIIKADNDSKIYTNNITLKEGIRTLKGNWDSEYIKKSSSSVKEYGTFISAENLLTQKKRYNIIIEYFLEGDDNKKSLSFYMDCPGIIFTCERLGVEIKRCYTEDNEFRAFLTIKGLEQSEQARMDPSVVLDYVLEAENKYVDINEYSKNRGALPLGSKILRLTKGDYVLKYNFKEDNFFKNIWLGYNDKIEWYCSEEEYPNVKFYDQKDCEVIKSEEVKIEEPAPIEQSEDIQEEAKAEEQIQEAIEQSKETPIEEPKETKKEEPKPTKKYDKEGPLKTLLIALAVIVGFSSWTLYTLKKQGYW